MLADLRLWTAIVLIAICGFSVTQGARIVHFSMATANIDLSENRAGTINRWTSVPGIALTALKIKLKEKFDASDPIAANNRRKTLSAVLSSEPLSSYNWLLLSDMQRATAQPTTRILSSLKLSALTGPNEGYIMPQRGIFSVSIWEDLPRDLKERAAMDLADGKLDNFDVRADLQRILSKKPERVRKEVRKTLVASGLSPNEIERRFGF